MELGAGNQGPVHGSRRFRGYRDRVEHTAAAVTSAKVKRPPTGADSWGPPDTASIGRTRIPRLS